MNMRRIAVFLQEAPSCSRSSTAPLVDECPASVNTRKKGVPTEKNSATMSDGFLFNESTVLREISVPTNNNPTRRKHRRRAQYVFW
jgi:hypothetical protein